MPDEDPKFDPIRADLAPALNVRHRSLQVCATCRDWRSIAGAGYCVRPGGFSCDVGDMTQYFMVCDRWRARLAGGNQ